MLDQFRRYLSDVREQISLRSQRKLFRKYQSHTMQSERSFAVNLELVMFHAAKLPMEDLSIVECGTWRGGMSFGILDAVPECRRLHMFDSFEGLPTPGDRDGERSRQLYAESLLISDRNTAGFEDVSASVDHFGLRHRIELHKGWFEDTVTPDAVGGPIGILRLDGDWYESTILVLERLFDSVVPGGIIIIDDYYTWPGCSQAVHQFLADRKAPEVLKVWRHEIAYIQKLPDGVLDAPPPESELEERRERKRAQQSAVS